MTHEGGGDGREAAEHEDRGNTGEDQKRKHLRRVLNAVTSFTEWTGPKGTKTAHAISRRDGGVLFFAGLWDRCDTDDAPADSYTMVMIDALGDDDVARFHNRQPVFLDRDRADTWLDLTVDPALILSGPPSRTYAADPPDPVVA